MSRQKEHGTVAGFIDHVGRQKFEAELGHTPQVVTRAIRKNTMPAHWFRDVRDWCVANGFSCPEHLFQWSRPSPVNKRIKQYANSDGLFKGKKQ